MTDQLQKKESFALREKTQYALTFGVIATMLVVAGFPMVVIFFFGIFAYFLWKTFSQPSQKGIKEVFEFYLSANEILRDDDRRWFGFEVHHSISRGESILQRMHGAPPLVYFALGALYNKIGDHESAVSHLSYIVENENADESTYLHPSRDLRDYVTLLRKIERDPKEAPLTSSAIRALERLRRNKGAALLEESRSKAPKTKKKELQGADAVGKKNGRPDENGEGRILHTVTESGMREKDRSSLRDRGQSDSGRGHHSSRERKDDFSERKPITEVLHDIYDKNVQ